MLTFFPDIDECVEVPGACSQMCINTIGNFTCKCNHGYHKTNDQRHCKKLDSKYLSCYHGNSRIDDQRHCKKIECKYSNCNHGYQRTND